MNTVGITKSKFLATIWMKNETHAPTYDCLYPIGSSYPDQFLKLSKTSRFLDSRSVTSVAGFQYSTSSACSGRGSRWHNSDRLDVWGATDLFLDFDLGRRRWRFGPQLDDINSGHLLHLLQLLHLYLFTSLGRGPWGCYLDLTLSVLCNQLQRASLDTVVILGQSTW